MKYLITIFLLLFTINSSFSNDVLYQPIESVGTCGTRENPTIYMQEKDCVKDHGTCAHLTVDCNYAKLVTQEVDDLEKPIFETIDKPCEGDEVQNLAEVCSETILKGYEKKTIYVTEIDGAKKLAYDAQQIQLKNLQQQRAQKKCGEEVVEFADSLFIGDNLVTPEAQNLTLQRTESVRKHLKDGILKLALIDANNVNIEGTLLNSSQKLVLIGKIQECVDKFQ